MATNNMVPYSNPAGNNQTTPTATPGASPVTSAPKIPGSTLGTTGTNPFMPGTGAGAVPGAPASPFSSKPMPMGAEAGAATGAGAATSSTAGGAKTNDLIKQFTDILGKGEGKALTDFLSGLGGTESDIFKQFLASMNPQKAQDKADFGTTMGAAGVSPNSTVGAIGQSNLLAKDYATESGVNASLMQHNQDLQSGILQNMEGLASKEVATSGLDVFAQVAGAVGNLAGPIMAGMGGAGGISKLFGKSAGLSTPSVGMDAFTRMGPTSIPEMGMQSLDIPGVPVG